VCERESEREREREREKGREERVCVYEKKMPAASSRLGRKRLSRGP